jgi:hypothetical protein
LALVSVSACEKKTSAVNLSIKGKLSGVFGSLANEKIEKVCGG